MHHVALTAPREEVARAIDAADDGNGIISQAEFRTILFALLAADPDAEQPLDLSGLGLPSYTPDLRHPHLVSRLDLSGNRLEDLPAALSVFSGLRELSLDDNLLRDVPPAACLPSLVRLAMRGNRLAGLPECLVALHALRFLHLDRNAFEVLPCSTVRLTALQELSLWGNPLLMPLRALNEAGLDMVLAYLAIFHSAQVSGSLDLRGMDLLRLPAEAELAPVRVVFLGGNRFAALPAELCAAAGLTALDASQGKLQTVPPAVFEGLTNLRSLNLACNRLKIVEATLGYLEARRRTACLRRRRAPETRPVRGFRARV